MGPYCLAHLVNCSCWSSDGICRVPLAMDREIDGRIYLVEISHDG